MSERRERLLTCLIGSDTTGCKLSTNTPLGLLVVQVEDPQIEGQPLTVEETSGSKTTFGEKD